ncbi:MAG: ABC transporter permease [Nostoc sp.]
MGVFCLSPTKEVGESATKAVVTSWVSIFLMDFFLSLLLFEQPEF